MAGRNHKQFFFLSFMVLRVNWARLAGCLTGLLSDCGWGWSLLKVSSGLCLVVDGWCWLSPGSSSGTVSWNPPTPVSPYGVNVLTAGQLGSKSRCPGRPGPKQMPFLWPSLGSLTDCHFLHTLLVKAVTDGPSTFQGRGQSATTWWEEFIATL